MECRTNKLLESTPYWRRGVESKNVTWKEFLECKHNQFKKIAGNYSLYIRVIDYVLMVYLKSGNYCNFAMRFVCESFKF